jgi:tungstate transport system substrate-binding protein
MIHRRNTLLAGLAAALPAHAQQRRSLTDPLRIGVDWVLVESGLAKALQQAFGRDTGVAVMIVPGPALSLLDTLERGELDAVLTNAPDAEARLDQQGLVHDRRAIAAGEFVIVGPAAAAKGRKITDPAGLAGVRDVAQALQQLRAAALAAPGSISFLSAGDGSGTHAAEQPLWRAAQIAPGGPWYRNAAPGRSLIDQARELGAYALVERGAWGMRGGAPLAVLVEGDTRLAESVHTMRSFRVNHPANKMFSAWVGGPKGRRVVAGLRSYRLPAG